MTAVGRHESRCMQNEIMASPTGSLRLIAEPIGLNPMEIVPRSVSLTQAFYLGYSRNAWNSTRINVYQPNSVSFDKDELKDRAENQRVQGSVFKIQSVPMLIVEGVSDKHGEVNLGVLPINEGQSHAYANLLLRLFAEPLSTFLSKFPSSSQNWLLMFGTPRLSISRTAFEPLLRRSYSRGSNHRLGWEDQPAKERYEEFQQFSEQIRSRFAASA